VASPVTKTPELPINNGIFNSEKSIIFFVRADPMLICMNGGPLPENCSWLL
jgi:hypothetical protein